MKNSKRVLLLSTFIFLTLFSFACGTVNYTITPAGEIKYGEENNQVRLNSVSGLVSMPEALPDDIQTDKNSNIYICEKHSPRILKYSPDMKFISAIEIPATAFTWDRSKSKVDIQIDSEQNVYALITSQDYFNNLVKFDRNGNFVSDFHVSSNPPERCTGFYISRGGKIFITTFPNNLTDTENISKGLVFVYGLDGKFLGRTDYFIEDMNGRAINRKLPASVFELRRYKVPGNSIVLTSQAICTDTLKRSNDDNASWNFLGVDSLNRVYFYQGIEDLLVRRFDFDNHTVKDIKIRNTAFRNANVIFKNMLHNICLAPSGDIYVCGLKNAAQQISSYEMQEAGYSLYSNFNIKDLSLEILKLHDTGASFF